MDQARLDALWDMADPAGSEARLRAAAGAEDDPVAQAELETQVARALGLQDRFVEADAVLDATATDGAVVVAARVALEQGRVRSGAGDPAAAIPLFAAAAGAAREAGDVFLVVDALHMLAIVDAGRSAAWTDEALGVLDAVTDPRTLRWRVSLLSNRGVALVGAGDLDAALAAFRAAREAAALHGTDQQRAWAQEDVDECLAAIAARDGGQPTSTGNDAS